jgi:hypothetical protein
MKTSIIWDDLEQRYIDKQGNLYKTIDDIPEDMRHLVKPIKALTRLRLRSVRGVAV